MPALDTTAVERAYRESSGRAVATLVRLFGDIDLAEEAVQEAFAVAVQRWAAAGVPPNPGGWIVTTARNKALDRSPRCTARVWPSACSTGPHRRRRARLRPARSRGQHAPSTLRPRSATAPWSPQVVMSG